MIIWILFAVFAILQFLDILTTVKVLDLPGGYESNKLVKAVMDRIGVLPALLLIKSFAVSGIAAAIFFAPDLAMIISLAAVCCFYLWVIVNNLNVLRRL